MTRQVEHKEYRVAVGAEPADRPIPALRADLLISPQLFYGQLCFVIKDPVTLRYFRMQPVEHMLAMQMDGQRTARDLLAILQQTEPERAHWGCRMFCGLSGCCMSRICWWGRGGGACRLAYEAAGRRGETEAFSGTRPELPLLQTPRLPARPPPRHPRQNHRPPPLHQGRRHRLPPPDFRRPVERPHAHGPLLPHVLQPPLLAEHGRPLLRLHCHQNLPRVRPRPHRQAFWRRSLQHGRDAIHRHPQLLLRYQRRMDDPLPRCTPLDQCRRHRRGTRHGRARHLRLAQHPRRRPAQPDRTQHHDFLAPSPPSSSTPTP